MATACILICITIIHIILWPSTLNRECIHRVGYEHTRGITKSFMELEQPAGSAWYADDAKITDYSGWSATEANNNHQKPIGSYGTMMIWIERYRQDCMWGIGNTWRNISGIIFDKRMAMKLRTQKYQTMVRSYMAYRLEQ